MFAKSRVPAWFLAGSQWRDLAERIHESHTTKGGVTALIPKLQEVSIRARRRIAERLANLTAKLEALTRRSNEQAFQLRKASAQFNLSAVLHKWSLADNDPK